MSTFASLPVRAAAIADGFRAAPEFGRLKALGFDIFRATARELEMSNIGALVCGMSKHGEKTAKPGSVFRGSRRMNIEDGWKREKHKSRQQKRKERLICRFKDAF